MKAMILAAGRGERLRPLTERTPKVLVEVAGEPLLFHQLRWLRTAGLYEVVINLHHLGSQIALRAGDGTRHGVQIRYSEEATLLETGGGVVNALPLLGSEPFVLLNGDIYTDFPFASLPQRPPAGSLAHILVTPRPAFRRRGDFEVDDGRVTARGESYVYCGIAVIDPAVVAGRRAEPFSLRDVYFELMSTGTLSAQVWDGYWSDIGTIEQLEAVNLRAGA